MSHPAYIAYLPLKIGADGYALATRVYNFEDPACPIAFDIRTRLRVREPRAMNFIMTPGEFSAMTSARH